MTLYEYLRVAKGSAYKAEQIKTYSWLKIKPEVDTTFGRIAGRSRIHGDIEPLMQDRVIDLLIEIATRHKMSYRDIAHILLFAKVESGFNPDAAAGTTSAAGLGQYTVKTVKEAAKPEISKSRLGFELDLSKENVLDAERGAFGVLLSYMMCKEAATRCFSPDAIEENTYLFHHEGWYFNPNSASNPERVADVHAIIAKKILPHLSPVEKLLQAKTQVQFALKTSDSKPYDNQPFVMVVPNGNTNKNAPIAVQGAIKPKVIIGQTDGSGYTPVIDVPGLAEVVFAPLNREYKKIIANFPVNASSASDTYTVKNGDTLSGIAKKNSTTVDELVEANHIANPNDIAPGMELSLHKGEYWWRRPSMEWLAAIIAPYIEAHTPLAAAAVIEHKRSHVALPKGNKAHGSHVEHNHIAIAGSKTKAAADAVKTAKKVPHQTNTEAIVKPVKLPSTPKADKKIIHGLLYPLAIKAIADYHTGARRFGSSRSHGTRKHAGVDLYAVKGTPVRAMADGVVLIVHDFYCQTAQIVVNHGTFIARYGEVDPRKANIFVKEGQQIKRGDPLGKVGHLVGIKVPSDMLHLEMYATTENPAKTSLTQKTLAPYQRRGDVFDPAPSIDISEME
ncbi:MAG: LysM peptidoglycan-binding domain-containing protein [Sulfuriferula sp.]|nr:LysM peptidoglycan-binding domain-containing protein [Sulfuriferula sp.]